MTPRDLRNIHTTRSSCREALPCANMALRLPCYFHLLMEKPLGRYFSLLTIRRHSATRKHLFPDPQGDRPGLRKPKKATTTVHLPKPVSTKVTIKPDSILTNLTGKDGGAKLVIVKHLSHKAFFCDTITRRVANQG